MPVCIKYFDSVGIATTLTSETEGLYKKSQVLAKPVRGVSKRAWYMYW